MQQGSYIFISKLNHLIIITLHKEAAVEREEKVVEEVLVTIFLKSQKYRNIPISM